MKENKSSTVNSIRIERDMAKILSAGRTVGLDLLPETFKLEIIAKIYEPIEGERLILDGCVLSADDISLLLRVEEFVNEMSDGVSIMPRVGIVLEDGKIFYSTNHRDFNFILRSDKFETIDLDECVNGVRFKHPFFRQLDGNTDIIKSMDLLIARERYFHLIATKTQKKHMFSLRRGDSDMVLLDVIHEYNSDDSTAYNLDIRCNANDMLTHGVSFRVLEDDKELIGTEVMQYILYGNKLSLLEVKENRDLNIDIIFDNFIDIIGSKNIIIDEKVYVKIEGVDMKFEIFSPEDYALIPKFINRYIKYNWDK